MRKHLSHFNKTSAIVNEYLDLLLYSLCTRCAINEKIPVSTDLLLSKVHHNGIFNDIVFGLRMRDIEKWENDIDHGLLHGLSTSIIAGIYMRNEFKSINWSLSNPSDPSYLSAKCGSEIIFERLHTTCLLHDYLKSKGHLQKNHDKDLKKYIPELMPEAFDHILPPHYNHPFYIADVVELKRYSHHKRWYKSGRIENIISQEDAGYFDLYMKNIRPAFQKCFEHRNESWARHGAEVEHDMSVSRYPQKAGFSKFPIEIDRPPFDYCFNHGVYPHIVNTWHVIQGIMPLSDFKKLATPVLNHENKHEVVHADFYSSFSDWVFVVNNDHPHQPEWVWDMIDTLIANGNRVVQGKTLNKFCKIANQTIDKLKFLSK